MSEKSNPTQAQLSQDQIELVEYHERLKSALEKNNTIFTKYTGISTSPLHASATGKNLKNPGNVNYLRNIEILYQKYEKKLISKKEIDDEIRSIAKMFSSEEDIKKLSRFLFPLKKSVSLKKQDTAIEKLSKNIFFRMAKGYINYFIIIVSFGFLNLNKVLELLKSFMDVDTEIKYNYSNLSSDEMVSILSEMNFLEQLINLANLKKKNFIAQKHLKTIVNRLLTREFLLEFPLTLSEGHKEIVNNYSHSLLSHISGYPDGVDHRKKRVPFDKIAFFTNRQIKNESPPIKENKFDKNKNPLLSDEKNDRKGFIEKNLMKRTERVTKKVLSNLAGGSALEPAIKKAFPLYTESEIISEEQYNHLEEYLYSFYGPVDAYTQSIIDLWKADVKVGKAVEKRMKTIKKRDKGQASRAARLAKLGL